MRFVRFALLLGLILFGAANLAGCLFRSPVAPQALFTASPVEQVIPFTANFDGTLSCSPNGKIASYLWSFGDGAAGSGPIVTHTYKENGTYVAQLTVIDERGVSSLTSLTVHALNPPPTASFSYSPKSRLEDAYIVGTNEPITFNASESIDDGEIVSYGWNFGDGQTATGIEVEHRYLSPGTYNVVLTVTDDDGDQSTFIEPVRVLGLPPCPSSPGGGSCEGGSCQ